MERQRMAEESVAGGSRLRMGMTFLSENPEAFGYLSDACPVATSSVLIAANGMTSVGGMSSPTFPVESEGVDGLFDELFGGLIHRSDDNMRLLRATFGEGEGIQEHPIPRYCAALAEAVALQVLDGPAKSASYEQIGAMLGSEIPRKLGRLRETVSDRTVNLRESVFFAVSLGVCRLTPCGEGDYDLDVFSAGDFRVFLLDGEGLHPIWLTDTPVLSPDVETVPSGRRLRIRHPDPFAILLLSNSVCALSGSEERVLQDNSGMIWRYRMRLEDQILRLVTSCVREQEFGERAARFFTGRSRGRDSASGAMAIVRGDASYEVFRSVCGARLTALESMISLMPDGYHPKKVPPDILRKDAEEERLRRLLEQEKTISDRASEALRLCALDKLRRGNRGEICPPPADVPAYRRLDWSEVYETYRRYDCENDEDRARIAENRRILRENLTDHWIRLRPYFQRVSNPKASEACERSFAACADMSARLGGMLKNRKQRLAELETLLSDSLTVLRTDGKDWLVGRAGDGSLSAWIGNLERELPSRLDAVSEEWQRETEEYRGLMTSYTYERELLFRKDALSEDGFFFTDWQGILDGRLAEERWDELRDGLGALSAYRDLVESLRRVSKGTGALLARVEGRGAERRMARELAKRSDLQIAALRASVYEDADWGESVISILDTSARREHRDAVRRWQETRELWARRKEAYDAYSVAYDAYLS